jgi:hypothetical protein
LGNAPSVYGQSGSRPRRPPALAQQAGEAICVGAALAGEVI